MAIYPKLVRNKIPARILAKGEHCVFRPLREDEKDEAIDTKVCEELLELLAARSGTPASSNRRENIIHEAADVLEVLSTILKREGITLNEVRTKMRLLREERGGFDEFILLEEAKPVR